MKLDKELQEYRDLMKPPGHFRDGFGWSSLLGAIFIALVMVPGAMYMHLVAGVGMGEAARWVTVIRFLEIARRTHRSLKNAEIFVLFYIATAMMAAPFEGLLFRQFFPQSKAVMSQGWQDQIPWWYAPTDPAVLGDRTFFRYEWLAPIGMVILFNVLSRLDSRILGFGLFKATSDYEKLPFPMAPVSAQGVLALAEEDNEGSWRWRAFSIGGAIGLIFGFLYLGLPILSSAILGVTMQPLPIPFVDWTGRTEDILPAVATGLTFDLTLLLVGMVMPFWAVVGAFAGYAITLALNPILYRHGVLTLWRPGDGTIATLFKNTVDFYFSFGLGLSLAIALVGFYSVWATVRRAKATREAREAIDGAAMRERGNMPNWLIIAVYFASCAIYIGISGVLIEWHRGVMIVLLVYAFVYTPLISYVTARLEGIAGQAVNIPYVREFGMILSGYQGLKVWFLPIPLQNYGQDTLIYRQAELTGTKFWSIWKADLFLVPIVLLSSICFASFIWSLAPIPSPAYPYADKIWEYQAMNQSLLYSSTMGEFSQFEKAFNPKLIGAGLATGLGGYGLLSVFGAPVLLFYGVVQGLTQSLQPHSAFLLLGGALLGRYFFQRRFGKQWKQYIPVITAGFSCGMGLIAMLAVGVIFLSKAVFQSSY